MKIYAASLLIIQDNGIRNKLFCFSLRDDDETTTPEQAANGLAQEFLPKEGEFQYRLLIQDIDVKAHFAQYVNKEFQESKEA